MYTITITKNRNLTEEEQQEIKAAKGRSYWYSNQDAPYFETTEQVLTTSIDEEQFKAVQKSLIETFK